MTRMTGRRCMTFPWRSSICSLASMVHPWSTLIRRALHMQVYPQVRIAPPPSLVLQSIRYKLLSPSSGSPSRPTFKAYSTISVVHWLMCNVNEYEDHVARLDRTLPWNVTSSENDESDAIWPNPGGWNIYSPNQSYKCNTEHGKSGKRLETV
jgi:hypothetical protein